MQTDPTIRLRQRRSGATKVRCPSCNGTTVGTIPSGLRAAPSTAAARPVRYLDWSCSSPSCGESGTLPLYQGAR